LFIAGVAFLISLAFISNRGLLANPGFYLSLMVLVGAYIVQRRNRWHYVRIGEHLAALEQEINERASRVYGSSVAPLTWEMKQKSIREAPRNALARWRYRAIG
jgi:hypothetical protein